MPDPTEILKDAAADVASKLPRDGVVKSFDPLSLLLLLVPVLQALLSECDRTPQRVKTLALEYPATSRDAVYQAARPIVGSQYSLLGRWFFARGRIDREASQIATAVVEAGWDAPVERIAAVMDAAREAQA